MARTAPRYASRTAWDLEWNRLARLAAQSRRAGVPILDLTETNPTRCGFEYDGPAILDALADSRALAYDPQPRGLDEARRAVAEYYRDWGATMDPGQVLLTSGSSEAYSFLFRLLAEPGENVLVPSPSYPLLEFLSRLNDVELAAYAIEYHRGWEIDFSTLEAAANARTRALIVVNPNNPTGSLVKPEEREKLADFRRRRGIALIADEVFLDYCLPEARAQAGSFAGETEALTFVLNGLSKTAALPQVKLGWIAVGGPPEEREEALARLEVIADTYLSVATQAQWALARLLAGRHGIQRQVLDRMTSNLGRLDELLRAHPACSRLEMDAGWSVILRVPSTRTDEEWALELLEHDGVLAHPGHFFNFRREGHLVASLIAPEGTFQEGVRRLLARVGSG